MKLCYKCVITSTFRIWHLWGIYGSAGFTVPTQFLSQMAHMGEQLAAANIFVL